MVAKKRIEDTSYVNDPKLNAELHPEANPDPITGEPGAHPIGTGLGAAGGAYAGAVGGAYAGAAAGTAVGPAGIAAGAVVGAIAGGVLGGYAGKGVAELVNPSEIDLYWSENYSARPYVEEGDEYDTYSPAYQYGYEARVKTPKKTFTDVEPSLKSDWETRNQELAWEDVRDAVRDSYDYTDTLYQKKLSDIK